MRIKTDDITRTGSSFKFTVSPQFSFFCRTLHDFILADFLKMLSVQGFPRAAAPVGVFSRGTTRISGSLSCTGDRKGRKSVASSY